jgi:hypothetical protein
MYLFCLALPYFETAIPYFQRLAASLGSAFATLSARSGRERVGSAHLATNNRSRFPLILAGLPPLRSEKADCTTDSAAQKQKIDRIWKKMNPSTPTISSGAGFARCRSPSARKRGQRLGDPPAIFARADGLDLPAAQERANIRRRLGRIEQSLA